MTFQKNNIYDHLRTAFIIKFRYKTFTIYLFSEIFYKKIRQDSNIQSKEKKKGKERKGKRKGEERKERKGKERKGKERKGKERKGKERKGKEKERKLKAVMARKNLQRYRNTGDVSTHEVWFLGLGYTVCDSCLSHGVCIKCKAHQH
ncbi:hypothetical protein llap_10568 [Limosa lapponica baueri]|uniref:Uncharacterized protein n=1 Tax=Limosa lapponica baueri TaxID=1758121 RepID=A0A2I0TZC6_LIMLA|nr:hypothetical protein llap_10568 [Limosa lapponica baueri]